MANLNEIAGKMNVSIKKESKSNSSSNLKNNSENSKRRTWLEESTEESIVLIETNDIRNWAFHDRPESEIGDIDLLSKDFLSIGQQQPCVVRPTPIGTKEKYELIIGERRWRAAKKSNLKLKVIIKDLSDLDSALMQSTENDNRKDLSEFAKGMSYANLINAGILTQQDLIEKLNKSKQYVSTLLSFSKILPEIIEAIGDMTLVSARTAETIKRLSSKGEEYISLIISNADKIRTGKIGSNKLSKLADNKTFKRPKKDTGKVVINGHHILSVRPKDNNELPSLHFPKTMVEHFNSIGINIERDLGLEIGKFIVDLLDNYKKSARAD